MVTKTHVEEVVLLDDAYRPIGIAPKLDVHHAKTPLHLAFSCYLFDTRGRLLVTRRADTKRVWPGVWTNSFCGHPAPGESFDDAIARRGRYELGITNPIYPTCAVPDYRYITPSYNGVIENEYCPVYVAELPSDITLNPDEVSDYRLMTWNEIWREVATHPEDFSYWLKEQIVLLDAYVRARYGVVREDR